MSRIERIEGRVVPVEDNDIDTDRIIPARFLKEITFSNMGNYPFYDERFETDGTLKPHPFNEDRFQGASLLVSNQNFGCGSSREHAPQALMRWGIRAIVAESFAEIFAGNCAMIGVVGVTASPEDIRLIMQTARENPTTVFSLDLASKALSWDGHRVAIDLPEGRRQALMEGTWDSTSLLLSNAEKARKVAARLPYLVGF
jgi:3-isopropylmalate/(R)-2-methylmalate dehydratase small subunit